MMLMSLKKMKHLEQLVDYTELSFSFEHGQEIRDIIVQNAGTLCVIKTSLPRLPDDGLITYPKLKELGCLTFDATTAARLCPTLEELEVKNEIIIDRQTPSLPSLKHIRNKINARVPGSVEFAGKNAATLMSIKCNSLPALCMPMLERLTIECDHPRDHIPGLPSELPEQVVSLPSLRGATIEVRERDVSRMGNLPLHQLISVGFWLSTLSLPELKQAITRICQLHNLKSISILAMKDFPADGHDFPDLFASLSSLQNIDICVFPHRGPKRVATICQGWAASLFRNVTDLRTLRMRQLPVSDEDLSLCARLRNLSVIALGNNVLQGYTIAGILSILRGAPRQTITQLMLATNDQKNVEIESELDQIEIERNVKFTRQLLQTIRLHRRPHASSPRQFLYRHRYSLAHVSS
jgi:hypothetical protein